MRREKAWLTALALTELTLSRSQKSLIDILWENALVTCSWCTARHSLPHNLRLCLRPLIHDIMDPASAIIGIVSFGLTVFKEINEIRKDFKDAPEQVRALQDECIGIEILLDTLSAVSPEVVPKSPRTVAHLNRLSDKARSCLEEVRAMSRKITSRTNLDKVTFGKWVMKRGDLKEMSQKLKDLRETLELMLHCINQNSLQFLIAVKIDSVDRPIGVKPAVFPQETIATMSTHCPRRRRRSQCPSNCTCRCHTRSLYPIIPQPAAPYLGQMFISPRIIDWMKFDPLGRCNVDTCRGTCLTPSKVTYILPRAPFHGSFQTTSFERVHFSLNAYRTVPYSSPIIQAIGSADVHEVRDLFAKQQASIWDVDIEGNSTLWHACWRWQDSPTEDRLQIIRFLAAAGADTLLFANTKTTYSAHDILALGLFEHLLREPDPGRSLATTIQTNSVATSMFRSIFNIDAMDALEDALSRQYGYSDDYTARLLTSLDTTEHSMARSSVFNAIGYTPLEYAVRFSPSTVESLLAEGFDASAEPTLAYATCAGRIGLFELLIDKGADVNMKDARGRTALHWACYQCYYNTFFELVRCAEDDIDWNSRTPEGQNALDLFETGMSEGWASGLTFTHVDEFRSAIISHMDCSQLQVVEDAPLVIPGAFPPEIEPSY